MTKEQRSFGSSCDPRRRPTRDGIQHSHVLRRIDDNRMHEIYSRLLGRHPTTAEATLIIHLYTTFKLRTPNAQTTRCTARGTRRSRVGVYHAGTTH